MVYSTDGHEEKNHTQPANTSRGIQAQSQFQPDSNGPGWFGRVSERAKSQQIRNDGAGGTTQIVYFTRSSATGGKVSQLIARYSQELKGKLAEVESLQAAIRELEELRVALEAEETNAADQ